MTDDNQGNPWVADQDQAEAFARDHGGQLLQAIDPNGPRIGCSCEACTDDATFVLSCGLGTPKVQRMAACASHVDVMLASGFSIYPSADADE